ncbi:Protein of unknown function [Bacillus cytotoxicus]|uniref:Uncharacterized protein n=1 Tax=Bacillus cytotoxicus TaxID=580165 RepID=A0AAX2CGY9_9BACI|nr:Protein of unknown function [Bacillus cytotoxicus]SCN36155.1 Protein of unknown function [Bacillus cytotoxicus]
MCKAVAQVGIAF